MELYFQMVTQACKSAFVPSRSGVEPLIRKVEVCYFGSQCFVAVEGSNLHFCNNLMIDCVEVPGKILSLTGSALQINVEKVKCGNLPLPALELKQSAKIQVYSPFLSHPLSHEFVEVSVVVCIL